MRNTRKILVGAIAAAALAAIRVTAYPFLATARVRDCPYGAPGAGPMGGGNSGPGMMGGGPRGGMGQGMMGGGPRGGFGPGMAGARATRWKIRPHGWRS